MGEEFERVAFRPIVVGKRKEIAPLCGAGIVDENVESAELTPRRLDQRNRRVRLAQIEHAHGRFAAFGPDRLRYFVERRPIAPGEDEITAFVGESKRDAASNAAARARYQGSLAIELELHSVFS